MGGGVQMSLQVLRLEVLRETVCGREQKEALLAQPANVSRISHLLRWITTNIETHACQVCHTFSTHSGRLRLCYHTHILIEVRKQTGDSIVRYFSSA